MQITGKIVWISDKAIIGEKQLEKVQVQVTETTPDYPNTLIMDFIGKGVEFASKYKVDDMVEVEYKTRVSEHNGKKYNGIKGWSIKSVSISDPVNGGDVNWWDDLPF